MTVEIRDLVYIGSFLLAAAAFIWRVPSKNDLNTLRADLNARINDLNARIDDYEHTD